jgi:hypothetical protein
MANKVLVVILVHKEKEARKVYKVKQVTLAYVV